VADAVEKVENGGAPKISGKSVFSCLRCCKPQRDTYEALWSISCDTMWPPTSARVRRAGGVEKFSSPVRKTFFDSIGPTPTTSAVHQSRQLF
jgi:hypothetical protein